MNGNIELPPFYDDLDASLAAAWDLLERGARDRRLMAHTPTLATVDEAGDPSARTVVLRACDTTARVLTFNTDRRSAKLIHLRQSGAAALHVYEPDEKIQLRLQCRTSLHIDDETASDRWAQSAPSSRICYQVEPGPGTPVDDPHHALNDPSANAGGESNFMAVCAHTVRLEWLYLSAVGHRRARFDWSGGDLAATWLVP